MPQIEFSDRVAIITGAGRGLGREYALEIARRGGKILVADIGGLDEAGGPWADGVAAEIADAGGIAAPCYDTVTTAAGGAAIVDAAMTHFGRVDVVIHNAGFLRPSFLENMTDQQLQEVMDVHLTGAFYVLRPAWRRMQAQRYGRVILTSSSSIFGYPACSNYVAAKAGLLGLTTSLALEGTSHNILVNAVLPFAITNIVADNPVIGETPMSTRVALKEMESRRHTRSVSPLAVYLASAACEVTGQAFSALSGRFARVALHLSKGWMGDADTTVPEDIARNMSKIADFGGGIYPKSMFEEIEAVHADLQAQGLI